jgi:hypothetical protein
MEEVEGRWRRLHSEELQNLYVSLNIIREDEMGGACSTDEEDGKYKIFTGKPEGKRPLGRSRDRWEDNITMDLREQFERVGMDASY